MTSTGTLSTKCGVGGMSFGAPLCFLVLKYFDFMSKCVFFDVPGHPCQTVASIPHGQCYYTFWWYGSGQMANKQMHIFHYARIFSDIASHSVRSGDLFPD